MTLKQIKTLPSQEVLKSYFSYCEVTGQLYWKVRAANSVTKGEVAGSIRKDGYRVIKIGNETYKAHRIIWKLVHGEEPNIIDHINGSPYDNRLLNLRSVTQVDNCRNMKTVKNTKSGIKGVTWNATTSMWRARIRVDGKEKALGCFSDLGIAIKVRQEAEKHLWS